MNELEVPFPMSGLYVDAHDAFGEQVVAGAIPTVDCRLSRPPLPESMLMRFGPSRPVNR